MKNILLLILMICSSALIAISYDGMTQECPVFFDYEWTTLDSVLARGTEITFTYTISIDSTKVKEYDWQRNYNINSFNFPAGKHFGSFITVATNSSNEETFTLSQLPITKYITVRVKGFTALTISMSVTGFYTSNCPDRYIIIDSKKIQQNTPVFMVVNDATRTGLRKGD